MARKAARSPSTTGAHPRGREVKGAAPSGLQVTRYAVRNIGLVGEGGVFGLPP
jgi:hypothetical protein